MNCSLILSSPSSPKPLSDCCKPDLQVLLWKKHWIHQDGENSVFYTASTYRLNNLNLKLQKPCTKKPQQKLSSPKEARLSQVTSDLNSFRFKCKNRAKEQDRDPWYFCSWEFQEVHSIGTSEVWRLGLWGRKEYFSERLSKFKEKSLLD